MASRPDPKLHSTGREGGIAPLLISVIHCTGLAQVVASVKHVAIGLASDHGTTLRDPVLTESSPKECVP